MADDVQHNLFGEPVGNDDWIRNYLAILDETAFEDRLARLRYVFRVYPEEHLFMLPVEAAFLFDEARMAYVNGEFVATILLAQGIIEHRLAFHLDLCGFEREAKAGLAAIIKHLRLTGEIHPYLLDRIDHLRRMRNPFSHWRPFDGPSDVSRRSVDADLSLEELMEQEAREALALMYTVATAHLSSRKWKKMPTLPVW